MEQRFKDSALEALRTLSEDAGPEGHMQLWAHPQPCWLRRSRSAECDLGIPQVLCDLFPILSTHA